MAFSHSRTVTVEIVNSLARIIQEFKPAAQTKCRWQEARCPKDLRAGRQPRVGEVAGLDLRDVGAVFRTAIENFITTRIVVLRLDICEVAGGRFFPIESRPGVRR